MSFTSASGFQTELILKFWGSFSNNEKISLFFPLLLHTPLLLLSSCFSKNLVCMYICAHTHTHARIHVDMKTCIYTPTHSSLSVCMVLLVFSGLNFLFETNSHYVTWRKTILYFVTRLLSLLLILLF